MTARIDKATCVRLLETFDNTILASCASPSSLQMAVEQNLSAWTVVRSSVLGGQIVRKPHATWTRVPIPAEENAITSLRLPEVGAAGFIDSILCDYADLRVETTLWTSPLSTPTELENILRHKKFFCEKRYPAVVRHLQEIRGTQSAPKGIQIQNLDDLSVYESYEHPLLGPITTARRRAKLESRARAKLWLADKVLYLTAFSGNKPVGTCTLFLAAGIAGIYEVRVLQAFRRRGIGTALSWAACRQALEGGYLYVGAQASWQGALLYSKLGFKEKFKMGYWYYSRKHHPPISRRIRSRKFKANGRFD